MTRTNREVYLFFAQPDLRASPLHPELARPMLIKERTKTTGAAGARAVLFADQLAGRFASLVTPVW